MSNRFENLKNSILARKHKTVDPVEVDDIKIHKSLLDPTKQKDKSTNDKLDNKTLMDKADYYDLQRQIFDLKLDIATIFSLLFDKEIVGEKLERKDIENFYLEFRMLKEHIINKLK